MFYHNIKRSKKRYIECPQVVPREQYYKTLLTRLKLYQRIASFNVPFAPFGAIFDAKIVMLYIAKTAIQNYPSKNFNASTNVPNNGKLAYKFKK